VRRAESKCSMVRRARRQQGYVLLTVLLVLALLAIAATIAAPAITFQIKRDREEELIHRGAQYARAIRRFAKRNGRYPLTLDELQGDANNRYLRRRYKDPITGKDFRLLHMEDIYIPAGLMTAKPGAPSADENAPAPSDSNASSPSDANAADPVSAAGSSNDPAAPGSLTNLGSPPRQAPGSALGNNNGNVGGEVIFGVASASKNTTIREFFHKTHYNQWLFFYDPNFDRDQEIKGPTSLVPLAAQALASPDPTASQNPQNSQPQNSTQPPQ